MVLLIGMGIIFADIWSWESIVLVVVLSVVLSVYAVKIEGSLRGTLPHGWTSRERFAKKWQGVCFAIGMVIWAIGMAPVGLPAAWGDESASGLGWSMVLEGIVLAIGSVPRLLSAVYLVRGK